MSDAVTRPFLLLQRFDPSTDGKPRMAPIENKRPQKEESSNSRKRQRITQEHGPPQGKAGLGSKGLDALPWNEVALPDRLDDAEGFLGLEEASGVEIVRDLSVGKVEYRVGKAS